MVRMVQGLVALVGRVLLVAIFLLSAFNDIGNYSPTLDMMRKQHNPVPYPEVLLPAAIAFLILGGVSVLIGYMARLGALLLLAFLVLATYYFHDFWNVTGDAERQGQMIHFFKNVSMMGAMVFLIAVGGGPGSVDEATRRRATA